MIRTAIVGLGKMGLSHLAILRAHPDLDVVAGCDSSGYLTDILAKYSGLRCHADLDRLLESEPLDALVVATPSKLHVGMVEKALARGLHVFCEKPFVLDPQDGERLAALAESKRSSTRSAITTASSAPSRRRRASCSSGALGTRAPRARRGLRAGRAATQGQHLALGQGEGGGASTTTPATPSTSSTSSSAFLSAVAGSFAMASSRSDVDDEIYCTLQFASGASGQLCVNWSDESFRKMSTEDLRLGHATDASTPIARSARSTCASPTRACRGFAKGWTIRYTTDLTEPVWYYLRGEEYSAQIDYFAQSIQAGRHDVENTFRSALAADSCGRHDGAAPDGRQCTAATGRGDWKGRARAPVR